MVPIMEMISLRMKILESIYYMRKNIGLYSQLSTKKNITKTLVLTFVKNLYIYLSSGGGENNANNKGITLEDLYNSYIDTVNWTLSFNKEEISKDRVNYFYDIQMDYLKGIRNTNTTFIYLNEEDKIQKLEVVLDQIREFGCTDEYFTYEEFRTFINKCKSSYLHIDEIDKFRNVGKIPKRLKKRKRII